MATTITVNGQHHTVDADGETPLLYILRNDLKLKGARFGCGLGQCGACTVVIDGKAVQSCDIPLSAAAGKRITTIEGIGDVEKPHPLQSAFLAEQAAQCGYCASGIIMTAYVLLARNPHPSEAEIRAALDGNLCRCGTHARILRAIKRVAGAAQ
jgi:aerobic-type carbon monoxide dehydrogenase small subunit (CoxS/CutS family)